MHAHMDKWMKGQWTAMLDEKTEATLVAKVHDQVMCPKL